MGAFYQFLGAYYQFLGACFYWGNVIIFTFTVGGKVLLGVIIDNWGQDNHFWGARFFVRVIINIWGQDYSQHVWSSFRATWKHLRCSQRAVEQNLTGM